MNLEVTCRRFLSRLADQYGKGGYYINNMLPLYMALFRKVPIVRLNNAFEDFIINNAGEKIPTIPTIKAFVGNTSGFDPEWYLSDKKQYCVHCRTDDHGLKGSLRVVWARFYSPKEQKDINLTISARCDDINCESHVGRGKTWLETIRDIRIIDKNATIRIDHYCGPQCTICKAGDKRAKIEGRVRATYQSDDMWEHRIKHGYVGIKDEDGQRYYYPIWEHKIWATSMGRVIAKEIGWERPEHVLKAYNKRNRSQQKNKSGWNKASLSDKSIDTIFKIYGY
tara:strand:- start:339 stop:1181 length:843 start_codon:yes stop_codon:yes gene_type:complete